MNLTPESVTLTIYDKNASIYGVCWQTENSGTPVLEYTSADDVSFERATRVFARCEKFNGMFRNAAEITGLTPGERYLWRVGDECGIFSEAAEFTAIDTASRELRFLVFADTQDGDNYGKFWIPAWHDAIHRYPSADLMLHPGDVVQDGADREQWKRMLGINREIVTSLPMLTTAGNHEFAAHHFRSPDAEWVNRTFGAEGDGFANIFAHYNIDVPPQNIERGIYYSLTVGDVHFTVLDSGDAEHMNYCGLTSEQVEWAVEDISSADSRWKIVMIHTPLYSPGKYGSRSDLLKNPKKLREYFNRVFADCGVDLVICGHDHMFSETYPIRADGSPERDCEYEVKELFGGFYRMARDPSGPIHFLAGCAGNQTRRVENEICAEETAYYRDWLDMPYGTVSYSFVRVNDSTLNIDYCIVMADTGEMLVRRRFGISKTK